MRSRANAQVKLQRRHFEAIARVIADIPTLGYSEHQRNQLAIFFANRLRWTNPNFDGDKFVQWANGDERSQSDIDRAERAAAKAQKAAEKAAIKSQQADLAALENFHKAQTLVAKLGG